MPPQIIHILHFLW